MSLDDKLKLLKRERDARGRSRKVENVWKKIDGSDESLSIKEKLEKLITLTGRKPASRAGEPAACAERGRPEPVRFLENPYRLAVRYGEVRIGEGLEIPGKSLAFLSHDGAFEGLSLDSALFLDLETTGLAGGTGTVPFLVGMGYYRDGQFKIAQYFLGEMADEDSMIRDLSRFLEGMEFKSVVTYNGKAFDIPLLETRFALHRRKFPLAGLPHLDFLFAARQLWKHRYESCRLFHLAREIVRAERDEDIPGAEIPMRYFQFIRTGDESLIEPIIYHNQEDILSLLGVVIAGAGLLADSDRADGPEPDAMDLFGAAKVLEKTGDRTRSAHLFRRALDGRLTRRVEVEAKKKLAAHFKRARDWEKAAALWEEISSAEPLTCLRELSMYHEHERKDLAEAIAAAERGLELAAGVSPSHETDFSHRLRRLRARLPKAKDDR